MALVHRSTHRQLAATSRCRSRRGAVGGERLRRPTRRLSFLYHLCGAGGDAARGHGRSRNSLSTERIRHRAGTGPRHRGHLNRLTVASIGTCERYNRRTTVKGTRPLHGTALNDSWGCSHRRRCRSATTAALATCTPRNSGDNTIVCVSRCRLLLLSPHRLCVRGRSNASRDVVPPPTATLALIAAPIAAAPDVAVRTNANLVAVVGPPPIHTVEGHDTPSAHLLARTRADPAKASRQNDVDGLTASDTDARQSHWSSVRRNTAVETRTKPKPVANGMQPSPQLTATVGRFRHHDDLGVVTSQHRRLAHGAVLRCCTTALVLARRLQHCLCVNRQRHVARL
jgi:hypothetical protein